MQAFGPVFADEDTAEAFLLFFAKAHPGLDVRSVDYKTLDETYCAFIDLQE